jgi:hypothetical protein
LPQIQRKNNNIYMKKAQSILLLLILISPILFTMTSCKSCGREKATLPPGWHCVGVTEVLQTSNYTYLHVEEDGNQYWMAVVSREAKTGDVLYYSKFMEMKDFQSKELNRNFPSILFVEDITDKLVKPEEGKMPLQSKGRPEVAKWSEVSVQPAKGGITIADLYKNPGAWSGKTTSIRGVIVKFSKEIMKKNWAHLQDGTEFGGKYDLTVTTPDTVQVGTTVTFTGVINLNKDFGYGYNYDVIMEDAKASDIAVK